MEDETMPLPPAPDTIDRFLSNESTAEERASVRAWAGARGRVSSVADAVSETFRSMAGRPADSEEYKQNLRHRLGYGASSVMDVHGCRAEAGVPRAGDVRRHDGFWPHVWRRTVLAAGVALGCIAGGIIVANTIPHRDNQPTHRATPTRYTTTLGQRALLTLRDGSRVILGPQSTLVVASDYGAASQSARRLTLSGEAYFDVTASATAPFVVNTAGITTKVLGTTFNLRHYPNDQAVQVFVRTGKVVTTGTASATTITAGGAAYVTDSTVRVTGISELRQYTDLANEQLVFNDIPVPELLGALGRWYGYEFRLADSTLATEHISAMIKASDATEMLKVLKAVLNVSMTFDGRIVRLVPKHSTPRERRSLQSVPTSMRVGTRTLTMEIGR